MPADDAVLVEGVVLVEAGPRRAHLVRVRVRVKARVRVRDSVRASVRVRVKG